MRKLVIYASISGNTKEVAEIVAETAGAELLSVSADLPDLSNYDLIFLGSYTWRDGKTPIEVKDFALKLGYKPKNIAVFGTGDTQWTYYCGAVDKLAKFYETTFSTLKVEQRPNRRDKEKITDWTKEVIDCYNELEF